jgi:cation diffusion facilitator CzcD-associated flavoprotein CzcO
VTQTAHVAIIGAGPYGLSCAAHFRALGIDHVIFGAPMAPWRETMPRGMHLKSDGFASSLYHPEGKLTLRDYCAARNLPYADLGMPVSLETFTAYGLEFQKQLVPYLDERMVTRVSPTLTGFDLELSDGARINVKRVVVAAGVHSYAHIPEELRHLPPEALSHSKEHQDPGALRGRRVAILGRGASALDLAMLAHEAGADVQLISRNPHIEFHSPPREMRSLWTKLRYPTTGVGPGLWNYFYWRTPNLFRYLPPAVRVHHVRTALGPAPAWFVRKRIESQIPMHLGYHVAGATYSSDRLSLALEGVSGTKTLVVDHLVAATGFIPEVARLPFFDANFAAQIKTYQGSPILSRHFESSAAGLYFVGLPAAVSFGPVMRFAVGAQFTAGRLSRALADGRATATTAASPAFAGA